MNSRTLTVALFLFVSGMCALIFQTAWLREFRLIFGGTTPASAAVLAIFMGGLGLGNAILGRRVDASSNPLKLYALFELGISAASIVSPFLIMLIRTVYFSLGGQESLGTVGATIVRLLLSMLVLGVPTFLMGGTLPAAARAATDAADRARGSVGWLYGLNTIGAVIGTLASTFVLLELLGNRETLWVAAAVNIVNAGLAWQLAKNWPAVQSNELDELAPAARAATRREEPASKNKRDPKHRSTGPARDALPLERPVSSGWFVYVSAGVVGFSFLLMEIVWYRMLGPILGGTTFTFGVILAVALAGIGVGGALYPLLFRGRVPTLRDLALTCGWEALALAVPLAIGDGLALLAAILRGLEYFGFGGQAAGWAIVATLVIFPAAVISGLQFPLLIALLGEGRRDVGKQVGYATAANTLGAMAGSLAGGFGLLPLLTAPGAWRLAIVVLAALSLTALVADVRTLKNWKGLVHPLSAAAAAGICLFAVGPTDIWRHSSIGAGRAQLPDKSRNAQLAWIRQKRTQLVWEAEGRESSVAIFADAAGISFSVNGKSDGNALTDAGTQIMFPLIGAMVHPSPQQALVIGLGTGESAGWLAELPSMQRVDVVELEPVIQHVARRCALLNHDVLHHPKVRLQFNDGREALQTSSRQYDLIASEPSNPYRAGVANLYTLEFYQSVRSRLAPRGLFVQWLQGYEIDALTVRTVLCTARQAFGHVEIWETKPADLVLVCSADPFDYDLARLRQRVREPVMREALRIGWQTSSVEGVLAHFVANEDFATAAVGEELGWINTDNHNVLEFMFARMVGRQVGFSVHGLRAEARSRGMHRPRGIGPDVDWEAVEDQWIAFHTAPGERPIPSSMFTGERAARAQALTDAFFQPDAKVALAAWNKQSRAPRDIAEVTILAHVHARAGDEQALSLIDQVRAFSAIDANALEGIWAQEKQDLPRAADRFIAAFQRMRVDPTGNSYVLQDSLERAVKLAASDRKQAPRLNAALAEPFAVMQLEQHRRKSRWEVARQVGDAAMIDALAEYEPHVPWEPELLQARWELYQRRRHPLEAAAARDVKEFERWMPEQAVLGRMGTPP